MRKRDFLKTFLGALPITAAAAHFRLDGKTPDDVVWITEEVPFKNPELISDFRENIESGIKQILASMGAYPQVTATYLHSRFHISISQKARELNYKFGHAYCS